MDNNSVPVRRASPRARTLAAGLAALALSLSLAACGEDATPSASASGSCGDVPTAAPKDPDGILAALPAAVRDDYNLYTSPVLASAWSNWKPKHDGPYKVGVLWQPAMNAFTTNVHDSFVDALEESGNVEIVDDVAPKDPTDVPGQLQQFGQVLAKKPDLIVLMPLAAEPFVELVDKAGAAGIPVVTPWLPVPSQYSIGFTSNAALASAQSAAQVISAMGGKGNVLKVHGIPGISSDNDAMAGFDAALAECPDVKVAGEATGNFSSAAAKSAVLQFLSTHPAGADGVLQAGVMTPGVIQAFEQLGKPVPPIADRGSTQGSLAYFAEHEDALVAGESTPDAAIGVVAAKIVLRTLNGDGPKTNQIITAPKQITREDLADIVASDWSTSSVGNASLSDDEFLDDTELDNFFNAK